MSERKEPRVSKALIEWLKEVLPKEDYSPTDTIEHIMYAEGKNHMVRFLEAVHDRQNK